MHHHSMSDPDRDLLQTRHSLLTRLKDWNDQESWRQFFDNYWRLIYNVAKKAGLSKEEAEEVVQETILGVAKKIHEFRCDPKAGSFRAWLLIQTRWRIADQFRKHTPAEVHRQAPGTQTTATSLIENIPDPNSALSEAIWDAEWEQNLLEAAAEKVKRRVKPEHFQMFHLNVVKHWPVKKIASSLGVNVPQVYLAKHRIGRLIKLEIDKLRKRPL